jgi:hypothetical protein
MPSEKKFLVSLKSMRLFMYFLPDPHILWLFLKSCPYVLVSGLQVDGAEGKEMPHDLTVLLN